MGGLDDDVLNSAPKEQQDHEESDEEEQEQEEEEEEEEEVKNDVSLHHLLHEKSGINFVSLRVDPSMSRYLLFNTSLSYID